MIPTRRKQKRKRSFKKTVSYTNDKKIVTEGFYETL